MQLRTHFSFTRWWRGMLDPSHIFSFSPLLPQLRVAGAVRQGVVQGAAGAAAAADDVIDGLEFVPESVSMALPMSEEGLRRWKEELQQAAAAAAAGADGDSTPDGLSEREGVWGVARFVSLLLGEVPRLRDAPGGYGPKGAGFIDHVDIPLEVEEAYEWLAGRYPGLLRH
jgi:hypothetical protein